MRDASRRKYIPTICKKSTFEINLKLYKLSKIYYRLLIKILYNCVEFKFKTIE